MRPENVAKDDVNPVAAANASPRTSKRLTETSKFLSFVLRHEPQAIGLTLDREGWANIAAVPDGKDGGKFTYDGDRPDRWKFHDDIWVHGYWAWDWAFRFVPKKNILVLCGEVRHSICGFLSHGVDSSIFSWSL